MTLNATRPPRAFHGINTGYHPEIRRIRDAVMVDELQIPRDKESDGDHAATHYLVADGKTKADCYGTVRVSIDRGERILCVDRVALLELYRGERYGADLLKHVVAEQTEWNPGYTVFAIALADNLGCYQAASFQPFENPYLVDGLKVQKMAIPSLPQVS